MLVRALERLELVFCVTTSLPFLFKQLSKFPRLESVRFEKAVALLDNAVLF